MIASMHQFTDGYGVIDVKAFVDTIIDKIEIKNFILSAGWSKTYIKSAHHEYLDHIIQPPWSEFVMLFDDENWALWMPLSLRRLSNGWAVWLQTNQFT